MIQADQQMQKMSGMFGGSMAKVSVFSMAPLDWGAVLIVLGSVVLLTAAALQDD